VRNARSPGLCTNEPSKSHALSWHLLRTCFPGLSILEACLTMLKPALNPEPHDLSRQLACCSTCYIPAQSRSPVHPLARLLTSATPSHLDLASPSPTTAQQHRHQRNQRHTRNQMTPDEHHRILTIPRHDARVRRRRKDPPRHRHARAPAIPQQHETERHKCQSEVAHPDDGDVSGVCFGRAGSRTRGEAGAGSGELGRDGRGGGPEEGGRNGPEGGGGRGEERDPEDGVACGGAAEEERQADGGDGKGGEEGDEVEGPGEGGGCGEGHGVWCSGALLRRSLIDCL